jgi:NAD(P)-dependent dehydrogenase (short-subunit alcohol dehydrogenase family)
MREQMRGYSGLAGRTALITGSSTGIGAAIALELAGHGVKVAVSSRDLGRAELQAERIRAAGGEAVAFAAELTAEDGPRRLVEEAATALGGLDLLVNSAGEGQFADSLELSKSDWDRIIGLDLTAPFLCAQAAAKIMAAAGRGVIVNVGSILGHVGMANRAAYSVAKHGLVGLTKTLAVELAPHGIRVVSVDPAYVATALLESTMASGGFDEDGLLRRTPLRRLATVEEVARVAAFLASDDAAYVTGSGLLVDGGWTADGGWPEKEIG